MKYVFSITTKTRYFFVLSIVIGSLSIRLTIQKQLVFPERWKVLRYLPYFSQVCCYAYYTVGQGVWSTIKTEVYKGGDAYGSLYRNSHRYRFVTRNSQYDHTHIHRTDY